MCTSPKWPLTLWVLLALTSISVITEAASLGQRIAPEHIQKCFAESGESFDCLMDQGVCYQLTPVTPATTPPQFLLTPCKGAPLVLNKSQQNRVASVKEKRNTRLHQCRELKKAHAEGQWVQKNASDLVPILWQLVRCLQSEADVEYDSKQEAQLYKKIVQLLTLLTRYPDSQKKAHHELAVLYEEYFNNYPVAFKHYQKSKKEGNKYIYLSLGRTACLSQDSSLQKSGLKYYLQAIEAGVLTIDVDNINARLMSLNSLLQQCGFEKLIPVIESNTALYKTKDKKDPLQTLAFIKKYLE